MKEKKLVSKWLQGELNHEELEAFKQLDAYSSYLKLSENAKRFKAPEFDSSQSYSSLKEKLNNSTRQKAKPSVLNFVLRIAAVFAIGFGLYFLMFNDPYTTISTQTAETKTITLPDASSVTLNAMTTLKYKQKNWDNNRTIKLDGEAFFKVATGKTFSVETAQGSVNVLGTAFNVLSRKGLFEVNCFEGKVRVEHIDNLIDLVASTTYKYHNGKVVNEEMLFKQPTWMENRSTFKSVNYSHVLSEFERQYNIVFELQNINTQQLFTGSFIHHNLENALQSITLPLQLTYTKENGKVILQKSE
jgi:transmembrane sensor